MPIELSENIIGRMGGLRYRKDCYGQKAMPVGYATDACPHEIDSSGIWRGYQALCASDGQVLESLSCSATQQLCCQALINCSLKLHSVFVLHMALSVTSNFRIQAVMATFLGLPFDNNLS